MATFLQQNTLKHTIISLYHVLIVHKKVKKFWEKSTAVQILWQKFGGGGKYTIHPPSAPGIGLKRHTFNIKHYLHKSYLHKKFILAYIQITKLLKKTISRSLLKKSIL